MEIAAIVCCFIIAIIGYLLDKKIYGVTGFMALFFGVIMLFAYIKPYPMYETTSDPYSMILIGVICYTLGAITNKIFPFKFKLKQNIDVDKNLINEKVYDYALLFVTITFIPYLFNTVRYILSGHSIGEMYYAFAASRYSGDSTLQIPYIFNAINEFIGKPLGYALIPLSIVLFELENRKKFLYSALWLTVIFVAVGFQRTYIVYFILYFGLLFFITKSNFLHGTREWIKKNRKKTIIIIAVMIIVFVGVSMSRIAVYGGTFDIGETLYYYYCICVNLMDHWLIEAKSMSWERTFGVFSFRGFFAPFTGILDIFGISTSKMELADYYLSRISSTVYVNDFKPRNTFVSIFFSFYIDGGLYGVVLFSFIIGYVAHQLFRNVKNEPTVYSITMFIMYYVSILASSMTFCNFLQISVFWSFFIMKLFFKKKQYTQRG